MVLIFITTTVFFSCGELSSKQRVETDEALKALRKIVVATEVGVNYGKYGSLIIDTKAKVNEVLLVLPDGDLKKEISAAIEAYVDASQVWGAKINGELFFGVLSPGDGLGEILIPKYNLTSPMGPEGIVFADFAIKQIWAIGDKHVDTASKLFEEK